MEYYDLFKKYKSDCNVFFETGTHIGNSVDAAYKLGFNRIISIEREERFYDYCMNRFQPLDAWEQIKLFLGRSEDNIEKLVLEWVNDKALFWLDAHENNSPYKTEIKAILKHPKKNHTIIVDDIEVYYIDVDWIKNKLLEYNPSYKFKIYEKKSLVCTA